MIKEIPFKEIDFDSIEKDKMSFDWEMFKGLYILVWEKEVGEANNTILYKSYLPKSLHWAVYNYINDNYKSTKRWSDL